MAPALGDQILHLDCFKFDCLKGIKKGEAGFLVAAPDRGYAGNQRVRASFQRLDNKRNAQLVFVTDERMRPYLKEAFGTTPTNNGSIY